MRRAWAALRQPQGAAPAEEPCVLLEEGRGGGASSPRSSTSQASSNEPSGPYSAQFQSQVAATAQAEPVAVPACVPEDRSLPATPALERTQAASPGRARAMPVRRGWDWKRSVRRQADLGRVLVGVRHWRRDAHGALADIAQEQASARCTQRVLDAQLDGADERQQEELYEEMERQVVVEVRLEELGARLYFLFEMVRALHRLDKHICRRKPPVHEAMASYYLIIEKALKELEAQGWALHSQSCVNHGRRRQGHPPAQRSFALNPIRGLVHELIEKAKQPPQQLLHTPDVAEPPLGTAAGAASASPATAETGSPLVEAAGAAPVARVLEFNGSAAQPGDQSPSAGASAPSQQPRQAVQATGEAQGDALPAEASREQLLGAGRAADTGEATSSGPGDKAPAEEQQAVLRETATAGQQPAGAGPQLSDAVAEEAPRPATQGPEPLPPEAADATSPSGLPSLPPVWRPGERLLPPGDQQPSSPTGSVRSAASFASPLHAPWAALPHTIFRSSGIRPTTEDSIKREPRVLALYHELRKGASASTIAWSSSGGGAGKAAARGRTAASMSSSAEATAVCSEAEAVLAQRAAEMRAFQASDMVEVVRFVVETQAALAAERAEPESAAGAAAKWPRARWRTLVQAAELYEQLAGMGAELGRWSTDTEADTAREAARLCSFLEGVSEAAGRISYHRAPLRVRMAEQEVPWEEELLVTVHWAAQAAAIALINHGLAEARGLARSKRSTAHAVLAPLANTAVGVFRVHQFAGGLNQDCAAAFDALYAITTHYARMVDPKWFRDTRVVAS